MLIRPKRLKSGDTIGIIAPATAVPSPDDQKKAVEILDLLGLRYKFASNLKKGTNYKSRTINERVDDLIEMFEDPDIDGIFCIRGGYGSGQIIDKIDYSIIQKNPKVFAGYSDITALHIALNKFANLVTYHSPVLISTFTEYTFNSFKQIIFGENQKPVIENPKSKFGVRNTFSFRTISPSKAEGRVITGNLSIICSLLGTDFEYDFNDSLLLIEDVGEEPYRIDRMLNHLRLAGKLKLVNGIIFARCDDCISKDNQIWDFSLGEVLDNYFKPLKVPSFYGLTFGHTAEQATIPIGPRGGMDSDKGVLEYLEKVID
ncbi:MAG: S66 peptidase family protein [Candidatus Kapaibacteriales bacterium]